jgi:integrase
LEESELSSLPFARASALWLAEHRRYLKPNTIRSYDCAIKALLPFFGTITLKDIHIGNLRGYQDYRRPKAGGYRINGEIGVLGMVMQEARCWKSLKELYRPLRVPKHRAGHSLTVDEEDRLRRVAFTRKKWQLAAHCITVMLSTTMGFGELSHVRRRDVDLQRKCVTVRDGAKNDYRDRTIPLNRAGYDSMCWIIDRWEALGGNQESQYILPHRPRSNGGPWLFDEPQTAIRSAFESIRKEAGLPHFRVYDCRVQAITKLLSNPAVSPQVSKEIAGHISQAMQDRYSIQQFDTKMAALEALEAPHPIPQKRPVEKISEITLDTVSSKGYNTRHG